MQTIFGISCKNFKPSEKYNFFDRPIGSRVNNTKHKNIFYLYFLTDVSNERVPIVRILGSYMVPEKFKMHMSTAVPDYMFFIAVTTYLDIDGNFYIGIYYYYMYIRILYIYI